MKRRRNLFLVMALISAISTFIVSYWVIPGLFSNPVANPISEDINFSGLFQMLLNYASPIIVILIFVIAVVLALIVVNGLRKDK